MDARLQQTKGVTGLQQTIAQPSARPETRTETIDGRLSAVVSRLAIVSANFKEMGDKLMGSQPEPVSERGGKPNQVSVLASIDDRLGELEMLADHLEAHHVRLSVV